MSIITNILTGGSNNHQTTSENANQVATDFVAEGVVGTTTNTSGVAPMTGALAVNAQGTPNMTVAVSAGVAYVTATPSGQASQALWVYNNASANVTIAANASGSTKYDWVYLSVSAANAANPNTAGDNVTTLVVSRSSSATSDDGTPPTYGYAIAVVTVANAASSITNGNITDVRTATGPAGSGTVVQVASTNFSAVNTGTTQVPFDDSKPQNNEGTEFVTQSITPKSTSNVLVIHAKLLVAVSTQRNVIAALFQDTTADALAATSQLFDTANFTYELNVVHKMAAGTTVPTTFKVRVGPDAAATVTFNGFSTARKFGGITLSNITITEYKA